MKKIILPLAFLIIGLLAGYLFGNRTSSNSVGLSHRINLDSAKMMITGYQTQNDTSKNPLLTASGERLKGYYIGRKTLVEILANKNNTGISFYLAKNAKRIKENGGYYTLVYVGTQVKRENHTAVNDTTAYDYIEECPNMCGVF